MARSTNNVVTHGLSGKVDLLVFRQRDGKTIVGKRPRRYATTTTAQQDIRASFKKAVLYAKSVMANEPLKLLYSAKAKGGQTAFNIAIADFFKAPQIGDIDAGSYNGQAGSGITVPVTDDFKVAAVKVKIESGDHSIADEGEATLQADGISWLYTSTQTLTSLSGSIITVTASDLPGHLSIKQKTI